MYSDILATIALVISLLTAGWTVYRATRWERPVISVTGWNATKLLSLSSHVPSDASFSMEVVNTGNHATEITGAWWELESRDGLGRRYTAGNSDRDFARPIAPPLPFTLERYQRRTWEWSIRVGMMPDETVATRGRPVIEYVSRNKKVEATGDWEVLQYQVQQRAIARQNGEGSADSAPPR